MGARRTSKLELFIDGPAGRLEAVLESPEHERAAALCVVCHPHPQHGGTMTNKVAHTLSRSMNGLGLETLRFNFRGVGRSEGSYAQGDGELDDALAMLEWARLRDPGTVLWIAGFSFGACVALRAARAAGVSRLIAVAPPVERCGIDGVLPRCPWLIVQGSADEVVDASTVSDWARRLPSDATFVELAGVDHFFHGKLRALDEVVREHAGPASAVLRGDNSHAG